MQGLPNPFVHVELEREGVWRVSVSSILHCMYACRATACGLMLGMSCQSILSLSRLVRE